MKDKIQLLIITVIAVAGLGMLTQFGYHLVISGIVMGVLTICGLAIIWIKSPGYVKSFLAKMDVLVDVVGTVVMFSWFGFSVTGLIGASVTCIFLSILLKANRIFYSKGVVR